MASYMVVLHYTNSNDPDPSPEAHKIAKGEEGKYDKVSLKYKPNFDVIIHVLMEDDTPARKQTKEQAIAGAPEWATFMLNETRYVRKDS